VAELAREIADVATSPLDDTARIESAMSLFDERRKGALVIDATMDAVLHLADVRGEAGLTKCDDSSRSRTSTGIRSFVRRKPTASAQSVHSEMTQRAGTAMRELTEHFAAALCRATVQLARDSPRRGNIHRIGDA